MHSPICPKGAIYPTLEQSPRPSTQRSHPPSPAGATCAPQPCLNPAPSGQIPLPFSIPPSPCPGAMIHDPYGVNSHSYIMHSPICPKGAVYPTLGQSPRPSTQRSHLPSPVGATCIPALSGPLPHYQAIQHRHHHKRQKCGRRQTTNDRHSKRPPQLRSTPQPHRHGRQSQHRCYRGHNNGT